MTKHNPLPPLERLNELFEVVSIHPSQFGIQSGLIRKISRGGQKVGSIGGHLGTHSVAKNRLDWSIKIDGKLYYVSRIIYYMVNKIDPAEIEVDHQDQNSLNNNADNLQLGTRLAQCTNRGIFSSNSSGLIGVSWYKRTKKWRVNLMHKGVNVLNSYFTCKLEAANTYNNKVIELGLDKMGKTLNNLNDIKCDCCK